MATNTIIPMKWDNQGKYSHKKQLSQMFQWSAIDQGKYGHWHPKSPMCFIEMGHNKENMANNIIIPYMFQRNGTDQGK